jgi:hypothetical protein
LKHLENFLTAVERSGFTFNITKCHFARPEVKFLGKIVGSGRYRPDPDKIVTVYGLKRPQTKKQVRQILEFFAHFHSYIPAYADVAKSLVDLTRKKTPNKLDWRQEHEDAFMRLRSLLCEAATKPLFIIDNNAPFNVSVDASNYAVSGMKVCTVYYVGETTEHVKNGYNRLARGGSHIGEISM